MPTFTINKKGGYEVEEVDAYIKSLDEQLKEYENKASAINKAIISAQMASDKMIKQANEDTASVIKKANEEAASIVKKANEEAAEITQKANDEKDRIMAEAQKCSAALAENADNQIKDIKNNISQQRALINSFSQEYNALVEKYTKTFDVEVANKMTKDLDDIEALVSDWEKNGIPEPTGKKQTQNMAVQVDANKQKLSSIAAFKAAVAESNKPKDSSASNQPQTSNQGQGQAQSVPAQQAGPLAPGSVNTQKSEEAPKEEAPKQFIKTGLAGAGLGGIPANPSYGMGGERTLKNSVSHSEAPKAEEAPEPVNTPNVDVPKFGEEASSEQNAQKPGIYKVSADNHLYNENEMTPLPKPGIYRVSSVYNTNTENQ